MKKIIISICLSVAFSFVAYAQKVGLVLSGGGAKGAVHIGLIKALEENEIPIDYIAGTSIGAIVGSLYAMGYTPDQMLALFTSEEFSHWQSGKVEEDYFYYFRKPFDTPEFTKFMISIKDSVDLKAVIMPKSFINPIQMNQAFMNLYAQAGAYSGYDFNRLFVPFLCVASDIYSKTPVIFRSGDIGDAVRASMTFPFFFKPIEKDSIPLFDGGIYDNFPVKPLKEAFKPDFIIGSSVVDPRRKKPSEQTLYDQIQNMIMQRTDYSIDPADGIIMRFRLNDVSLLEFNRSKELFIIGYRRGTAMADSIKKQIVRRQHPDELNERRKAFAEQLPPLIFQNIHIKGISEAQKMYVESQIHRNANGQFTMEEFKKSYFRLLADSKIKEIVPHALYNKENNTFDLLLDIIINDEIMVAFGGNVSSLNANQLYLGLGYQSLTEHSLNVNLDMQVGNAYDGVVMRGRLELASRIPIYLSGLLAYNSRKYYNSDQLFIDTELSTFIHQREGYGKIGVGLPFMNKTKVELMLGYGSLEDKYYQSNTGSFYGTSFDRSQYSFFSASTSIHRSTLDAKQYPTSGREHILIAQYITGSEHFIPADRSAGKDGHDQSWVQIKGKINDYYHISSKFNLGYIGEIMLSGKNLLSNYTASVLQAPSFSPTPHSKLVFNEAFHANQYIAGGITPILKMSRMVHLRGDFNVFAPLHPINRGKDGAAEYGEFFSKVSHLGEVSLVVQLPFMSIGFYGNHYNFPRNNWNFGLNIGYLIFGPKFIQ